MELLKKYGPLIALVVAPIFLILVAVFAPEQFDRVLESLGLLLAGLFGGVGVSTVKKPGIKKKTEGFIRLDMLWCIAAVFAAIILVGCGGPQRCPDGDPILVSHKTSAPSSLIAKCSSESFDRVSLGSSRAMKLFGTCGPGKAPVLLEPRRVSCGADGEGCVTARFTCAVAP